MSGTVWLALALAPGFVSGVRSGEGKAEKPLPYAEEEVRIQTPSPGVVLAGTLTVPTGKGPHPAALLIPGDGPHTRDQVISGSPMFRQIADHLTRHGLAVLRVDKRGVGKSRGPSPGDSTTAELAEDARASFAFLRQHPAVDPERVGLIGHSEGALIAPLAAVKEPRVKFVVLLAPPGVPGSEVWVAQQLRGAKERGLEPARAAAVEKQMRRFVEFIGAGGKDDEAFYRLGRDYIAAHGYPDAKITHDLIDKVLGGFRGRWYPFFFTHDPAKPLRELRVPLLAAFGSADRQVTVEQNLGGLAATLAAAKNPDFTLAVLPDQDHFFLLYEGHRLEKHRFGKMEVAPALLDLVTEWVRRRVS
jgi:pimeloyl-ACP methyl ester carboxylesterase